MNKSILFTISLLIYSLLASSVFASISISPLKHELEIAQWKQLVKSVKITNESESPITLYTSSEDFTAWDETGQPKFLKPEDQEFPELSLSNWIELNEKNITLSPFETKEVNFTIKVPKNWEPGGHYGAVFFSPWIQSWVEVGFAKRIWVLVLINVPGDTIISWNLEKVEIWAFENEIFNTKSSFDTLPIVFKSQFKNEWNIHLKPRWKIELIDEEWNVLKNVWKETLKSTNGTFIWEKLVDYVPINSVEWNVLPKSTRAFQSLWEGFGYSIINEDGTRWVEFKTIEEYYLNKGEEQKQYLSFWEALHIRKVKKRIVAKYDLSYTSKDAETKSFQWEKNFYIEYKEKYIWLNYLVVWLLIIILWGWAYLFFYFIPKNKGKQEEAMRKKILEEMKNNK
jgi:hypothetical protein